MARFFKPLLSAVALAATALTSTATLAAYSYNAQISVTAPKASNAEAAAKDKTLPAGVKYTTCAARKSGAPNWDQFTLTVKYDAGKTTSEVGDVYVVLQNLTNKVDATNTVGRYIFLQRDVGTQGLDTTGGVVAVALQDSATLATLTNDPNNLTTPTGTPWPYLRANDNLGLGAQTETVFGGTLSMEGLPQGLWTASVIIAKPGAKMTTFAGAEATMTAAEYEAAFSLARPETWAASDTVAFVLGTPLDDAAGALVASSDCQ